mgnify:CR=1 FL=1
MFRNFLAGRYGVDHLTRAMLIAGIVLTFLGNAFDLYLFTLLSYLMFFGSVYRTTSRKFDVRRNENNKFLKYYKPAKSWVINKYKIASSSRYYKYFNCPSCNSQLRVPRGKGKISVTCNKCNHKFLQKS